MIVLRRTRDQPADYRFGLLLRTTNQGSFPGTKTPDTEKTFVHPCATFADIVVSGAIEKIAATPAERANDDNVDLPRIRLHFDRRHLGRLRLMVDRLNAAAQDSLP